MNTEVKNTPRCKTVLHRSLMCLGVMSLAVVSPPTSKNTACFAPLMQSAFAATEQELSAKLFDKDADENAFDAAVKQARAAKLSEQLIFEAWLLRTIREADTAVLAQLAANNATQKYLGAPDLKSSVLFKTEQSAGAMLHGLRAVEAGEKNDAETFEREIKAAFWGAPDMAGLFGGWAGAFQEKQRMANFTLPLDLKLQTSDGKTTTLKEVLGDNKALLLDFWASWCGPCMNTMAELKERSHKLRPQGVVVVGMNTENDAAKATRVKQDKGMDLPWLLEPEGEPYSAPLGIDSIPRNILVSAEGKVLFNGHPSDTKLQTALEKLGATL